MLSPMFQFLSEVVYFVHYVCGYVGDIFTSLSFTSSPLAILFFAIPVVGFTFGLLKRLLSM